VLAAWAGRDDPRGGRPLPHIRAVCHVAGTLSPIVLPPFWSLVEAHGDELLVHARRIAGNPHAEDVLQEALLRALRAYPRLRHAEHLRAWLYRVTTTTALDHVRARRREVLTDAPPAAVADPELYDDAFESLIDGLPGGTQAALRLRFVEDLDYDGIAARLGCSAAAARQRVSTAIRTLRAEGIPA
jgi:RNA polymerase sigma-70 factor (ECF subfamily)